MNTFDLYLAPAPNAEGDSDVAWRTLATTPGVRPTDDPGRLLYRNEDTAVYFHVLLGDDVLAARRRAEQRQADEDGIPAHLDPFGDAPGGSGSAREREEHIDETPEEAEEGDDAEEDVGEEDGEEDEDELEPAAVPPITLVVPIFHPTFFLVEALHVARAVCREAGFHATLSDGLEEGGVEANGAAGGEGSGDDRDDTAELATRPILSSWRLLHRGVWQEIPGPKQVQVWSEERCAEFHAWGAALPELRDRFGDDGLEVAAMQPARHGQLVKTLCVWDLARGAVLPHSDLVLLRWESRPRGLLRRRKVEEAIATGDEVWRALDGRAERIETPVPALVVRGLDLSGGLGGSLGELGTIRPEDVRRTELSGIVDFALEPSTGEDG